MLIYRPEQVYQWEALIEAWFRLGNVTRMVYSARQMAALQPGSADAYLTGLLPINAGAQ